MAAAQYVAVRQPRMSQRISGIEVSRLSEELDCLPVSLTGSLLPEVTSLEIKVISLRVFGMAFGRLQSFGRSQLLGDFPRDLRLHERQVGGSASIFRAPELAIFARVDQLDANDELAGVRRHLSGQNRLNLQLAPGGLRIDVPPLVAEDLIARPHSQVGHLSKSVDQALGDAVRQILGLRNPVRVDERQDGDGLYPLVAFVEVNDAGDYRNQRGHRNCG